MTREETWERLIELGAVKGGISKGKWNLYGADLSEADLSEADLSGARLYRADLYGANLHGANLTESTLNDVNFNLADLSGVDITGSTFWGVSTAGWRIDHIKAQYVYFCRALDKEREKYRRNFEEGQFEELFKSLPTVELIFEKGLSPSGLFALAALIEKIGGQNPDLGIKMASISKNAFETKVGVSVDKDEHLSEVVQLMQEAMRKDAKGIQAEMLVPLLSQMFPEWGATLVEALQKQPTPLFINYHYEPTYNIITSNGESGPITQYGNVQSGGNVFINYKQNKEEINRLFAKLNEAFGAYEASMRNTLVETTDNMIEAIRKGKEVERIQEYWEQIKEGIKTGAGVTTVAMNLVPHVARLLGLVP